MRIDVYHHIILPEPFMAVVQAGIYTIIANQERTMATLEDIKADMEAETTSIGGLSTLIQGLKQQLADALSGASLPPAVQAKVDAIFANAEANKQALADALAANTPTP